MEKFTWHPDLGAQRQVQPAVTPTKFGDGYELRTSDQLNSVKRNWTLTFTHAQPVVDAILDFLERQAGLLAFDYDDPRGKPGRYVCRQWSSSQIKFGVFQVQASFEEVFEY